MRDDKDNADVITALKVHQWLPEWTEVVDFDDPKRREPEHHFYLFSMSAFDLKRLCGIRRRGETEGRRGREDLGIQRRHDEDRSDDIAEYVRYGYPWSDLSKRQRASERCSEFRKPGWLPTAIIVNIRAAGEQAGYPRLDVGDAVDVREEGETASIILPEGFRDPDWSPSALPIEVIDGQHRLWAFIDMEEQAGYEVPVVAFHDLAVSWQAYLFWTINIRPKRINPSLAFDLYPLLRTEEWLTQAEHHWVYREARAQELVELLWLHPASPWQGRINMLGERPTQFGRPSVTQNAWVHSLYSTYLKAWSGRGIQIGGLFGAPMAEGEEPPLPWTRPEQAAFLTYVWEKMRAAVSTVAAEWAQALRAEEERGGLPEDEDLAFAGEHSLLCTDAGVRGFHDVTNALFYVSAAILGFKDLYSESGDEDSDALSDDPDVLQGMMTRALDEIRANESVTQFINELTGMLATYDWRTYSAESLEGERQRAERQRKRGLRGSGGYKAMREELLRHLRDASDDIRKAASEVEERLGGIS